MVARYINPRKERSLARRKSTREIKQSFFIVCEGKNTEPEYFHSFRLTSATVKVLGQGINTIGLVKSAIKEKEQAKLRGKIYDNYWVVFDKDDFPNQHFNDAIKLAEMNGFRVAYSNQAFEYWFLLHFNLYEGVIERGRYTQMLSRHLGEQYGKDVDFASKMYNKLLSKQATAITNARTVHSKVNGIISPAQAESSTTIYLLVEELNKYL